MPTLNKSEELRKLAEEMINKMAPNLNVHENYLFRGDYWQQHMGEYDEAIIDYTKAIELKPDYAEAYNNRAIAWTHKNEYNKAIDDCTKAIELKPDFAQSYNTRGIALRNFYEYDKAIEDYTKTIELNPDFAESYFNRGMVWSDKDEYKRAIEDYTKFIELRSDFAPVYNNRGVAWRKINEYDKAIEDYTKTVELKPDYAEAYNNRGITWALKNEYNRAIEDYTKAIELKPDYADAYNNRGSAFATKKKYNKAIEDCTKAIELKPDYADVYFMLYHLYKDVDKTPLVLPCLNRANYLESKKISGLITAYHQSYFLPFMLRRVLQKVNLGQIKTLLDTYSENERLCKNWEMILAIINNDDSYKNDVTVLKLNAFVNYFMGDCIESFHIYDKDIHNTRGFSPNLRDQYYYVKSAQDFLEPYESILRFALTQAESDAQESVENLYYAGQLFLLNGNTQKALSYFSHAASFGFRPALYQLAGLYKKLDDRLELNKVCERLKSLEEENEYRYRLLNGIAPLIITKETDLLKEVYDYCKYYAFYGESIEEIQLVRTLLNVNYPYKRYEFWELIQFDDKAEEIFDGKIRQYELREFEHLLFEAFERFCHAQSEVGFEKRISNSSQAIQAFTDLEILVERREVSCEKAMALKIRDMERQEVLAKWYLVFTKLFYLQGKLSIKSAVCLHMYSEELAIQFKDKSIFEDLHSEVESWVSEIVKTSPIVTKLIFKTLKFIQDGLAFPKHDENDYKQFEEFKNKFYDHLEFWRNSLMKEFVEKAT